jgi:hypothetical protein
MPFIANIIQTYETNYANNSFSFLKKTIILEVRISSSKIHVLAFLYLAYSAKKKDA